MFSQLNTWIAVLALLLGVIALVIEIFVLPGFGVAGLAGIILVGWGIFLMAVDVTQATMALVWALAATVVLIFAGVKLFNKLNLWKRLTLDTKQKNDQGYVAPREGLAAYVGKTGVALTPLRPSGTAEISGERLDVVTEGDFISPGAAVQVVRVEGTRVLVKGYNKDRI
jgi:membrane-bound serine protease (ClpP class)